MLFYSVSVLLFSTVLFRSVTSHVVLLRSILYDVIRPFRSTWIRLSLFYSGFFFFFLSVQFYPVKLDPSRQFRLVRSFQFCPAFSSSAVLLFLFCRYSLPPCSALPPLYSTPSCSGQFGADPSCRSTRFYFVLRSVLFPVQIHGILFSAFLL